MKRRRRRRPATEAASRTEGDSRARKPPKGRRGPDRSALLLALIVALTVIAYIPALEADLVWDDDTYVTHNTALQSAAGLRDIWFAPTLVPAYYPVLFTMLWVEYQVWGADPTGYHWMNVILHALNVVLVWLLLQRLAVPGAIFAAGLFALHPVHVESVAWITERKDVLSGTFMLLGLIVWNRYLETGARWRYAATFVAHLAAMLSKSVASIFPLLMALLAWWRKPEAWRRNVLLALPMLMVSVAFALVTKWRETLDASVDEQRSVVEAILLAARNGVFYLWKFVAPFNLMAVYPKWQIDASNPALYVFPLGLIALLAVLWIGRRRWGPGPLVGVLFFFICHLPTIGLVRFNFMNYSYVADRYQYLAILGLCAVIAALAARLPEVAARLRARNAAQATATGARSRAGTMHDAARPRALGIAAAVLLGLATLTWTHARHFHDIERLARHNLAENPRAWSALTILGLEHAKRGELDRAAERFSEALEILPEYGTARYNLALMHFRQGRLDDAVRELETLIAIDPDYPDAHYSLGVLLNRQGRMEPAIAALRRALAEAEARPASRRLIPATAVRLELANSLYLAGNFGEAAKHYRRLLEAIDGDEASSIDPDYVTLSLFLSAWSAGHRDQAIAYLTDPSTPPEAAGGPPPARAPAPRSPWMTRIHAFYLGRITAEDLIRAARESSAGERRERLCEAHFYIGMERLLTGDRDAARRSFQACIETGATHYFEYRRAERELERLGG